MLKSQKQIVEMVKIIVYNSMSYKREYKTQPVETTETTAEPIIQL